MSRYRFALRPKWILSHLFVLALLVTFLLCSRWQFHRLHEKRVRNARVESRTAEPAEPIGKLADVGTSPDRIDDLEYRQASATGRYLRDQEVIVRSRSNDGAPGAWVLTPLDLGHGVAVTVNRGWIPSNGGLITKVPAKYRAPSDEVTVVGLVRKTETRGSFGPRDPKTGTLTDLARADVARLDQQVPERLLPLYLQLQTQDPKVRASDPDPVPKPELDEGPHLSYAIQWLIFTAVGLIGYPLILRRRAREVEREALEAELDQPDPDDEPGPDDPRLDPVAGA